MSTFSGKMKEYRDISIDRFDGNNLTSTVFFLSHCHRDHMVGLSSRAFGERLRRNADIFLYMTDVSKVLLMGDNSYNFHHLEPYIRTLDKGANTIYLPNNDAPKKAKFVSVTTLPAGHCPGSVMFLFEGVEGAVLYTGDFRWEVNSSSKCPALKNELGIKPIKSLYIDTTFCIPNAFHFPSRAQCVEVTVQLIKEWLNHSPSTFVYVASPANYGHEHLHVEIFKNTRHKIHTSDWKFSVYSQIQDLSAAYTTDPSTRIHACGFKKQLNSKSCLPCGHLFDTEDEELKLLVIRPSTMWFTMSTIRSEILVQKPEKLNEPHRVCYSFHSSYSEIKDMVSYLNPDQVFPNVIPPNELDTQIVQARLNSFLKPKESKKSEKSTQVLGELKTKISRKRLKSPSFSDSEELIFESPVKVKKPKIGVEKLDADILETGYQHVERSSPAKSNADSSYDGSNDSGSELDLCPTPIKNSQTSNHSNDAEQAHSTPELIKLAFDVRESESKGLKSKKVNHNKIPSLERDEVIIQSWQDEPEALRLYISSDSESEPENDLEPEDQIQNNDNQISVNGCDNVNQLQTVSLCNSRSGLYNTTVRNVLSDKMVSVSATEFSETKICSGAFNSRTECMVNSEKVLLQRESQLNSDSQNQNVQIQRENSFKDDLDELLLFQNTTRKKSKSVQDTNTNNIKNDHGTGKFKSENSIQIQQTQVHKTCSNVLQKCHEKLRNKIGDTDKLQNESSHETKHFKNSESGDEIIIIEIDSEPLTNSQSDDKISNCNQSKDNIIYSKSKNKICSQSHDNDSVCSQSNNRTLVQSDERISISSQSSESDKSESILRCNVSSMVEIEGKIDCESDSDTTLPPSQNSFTQSTLPSDCDDSDIEIIS